MRMFLIAVALAGLGAGLGDARAEPVRLDEGGLRAVAAGEASPAGPVNVNVSVANPVSVSNQVDVTNQVGAGVAVGVNAAVAMFSSNVVASGGVASTVGLSGGAP